MNVAKAVSMSRSLLASRTMSCWPIASAAAWHVSSLGLGIRSARIPEHGNRRRLGHKLAQQTQPLRANRLPKNTDTRDVATRPVEAGDETVADRVAPGREDDRDRRGRGLGGECRRVQLPTITATGRRINSAASVGNRSS